MQSFDNFGLDDLQNPIWIYDVIEFQIYWANSAALKLWETDDLEELRNRDFKSDSSEAVRQTLLGYLRDFEAGRSIECWWRISPKGIDKQVFMLFTGIKIKDGRTAMLVEGIHSELLNRYAGEVGKSSILGLFNNRGALLSFNPPFKDQFGHSISEFSDLFTDAIDLNSLIKPDESHYEGDQLFITTQGHRWHRLELNREVSTSGIIATLTDIHERKLSELKYVYASVTDSLTGLYNRRGLLEQLQELQGTPHTLFYIDLDGFKPINDSYGHSVGDALLQKVARILQRDIHEHVLCARLGGDEFILVITAPLTQEERQYIGQSLLKRLSTPMQVDNCHRTLISASIGVAHSPNDENDELNNILVCADAAMYIAKRSGRNRLVSYAPGMEEHLLKRSRIVQSLEEAIINNELSLYYQLIYHNSTQTAVGAEALLRWNHPTLGNISPLEIITAAEETGRISTLENWVIRRACLDLVALKARYGDTFKVSINISGAHLTQANFIDDITSVLAETNTMPSDILLELTESVLVSALESDQSTLQQMSASGFMFAIDDFGTGYSSLAYLNQIPASFVKVDKAFIDNIEHNPHTVRFIRDLCQSLDIECLVEGVETQAQVDQINLLDIPYRQGFFYARPVPLEQLS